MSEATSSLFTAVVPAPFGRMGIRLEAGELRELVYLPPAYELRAPRDALSRDIAAQLKAYFKQPDFAFELTLPDVGTEHQRKVWQQITAIPCGEVLTYAQVARRIGSAPRAVGQACGANWFPLIIPCHRVTAANGIGGFARHDSGFHQEVKRWLLRHERVPGYC
jgi:methylated-DNA-[protein]-cysteine S-methyltransferase